MPHRLLFGFLSVYGLLIAIAIALGVFLCSRREKELGLPRDISIDLVLWAIPAAIIGARAYYVAFQWPLYAASPVRALFIWEGGLAIYGGVIGGIAGAWLFSRRKSVPLTCLTDLAAPSLLLGQAIGRWGNFFNGEAYGTAVENPALQFFPLAVYADGQWHMAAFFYESVWDFLGFLLLWHVRKRMTARGNLFLLYLCWYGLGRMVIEGIRTDSLMWGSVRVSQALSAALFLAGGILFLIRQKKHAGEMPYPLPAKEEANPS